MLFQEVPCGLSALEVHKLFVHCVDPLFPTLVKASPYSRVHD